MRKKATHGRDGEKGGRRRVGYSRCHRDTSPNKTLYLTRKLGWNESTTGLSCNKKNLKNESETCILPNKENQKNEPEICILPNKENLKNEHEDRNNTFVTDASRLSSFAGLASLEDYGGVCPGGCSEM